MRKRRLILLAFLIIVLAVLLASLVTVLTSDRAINVISALFPERPIVGKTDTWREIPLIGTFLPEFEGATELRYEYSSQRRVDVIRVTGKAEPVVVEAVVKAHPELNPVGGDNDWTHDPLADWIRKNDPRRELAGLRILYHWYDDGKSFFFAYDPKDRTFWAVCFVDRARDRAAREGLAPSHD